MRGEVPSSISESNSSTIRFTPFEVGFMSGEFDFAAQNFGNDKEFSWTSGAGEKNYRISLVDKGLAFDDGDIVKVWDIEIAHPNKSIIFYLQLGKREDALIHPVLIDRATGEEANPEAYSAVMDAVLDLQDELQEPAYDSVDIVRDGQLWQGRGMRNA